MTTKFVAQTRSYFLLGCFWPESKIMQKIGHHNVREAGLKKKFENDARLPVLLCRGYIIIWKAVDRPPPSAW